MRLRRNSKTSRFRRLFSREKISAIRQKGKKEVLEIPEDLQPEQIIDKPNQEEEE